MNIALWIVQGLLALAFLFAGASKALMPAANLSKNMVWTKDVGLSFTRFIGVAEVLGAIGLILPAVTHIQTWLTVAAAGGLVIVMLSASIFHLSRKENSNVGGTIVLLLLAAFIIVGRLVWAPLA